MRNPRWTRDELILALDLYFRLNPLHTSEQNPEIRALSEILNRIPRSGEVSDPRTYRNANGVYMKLCNFLRLDPSYSGKGLRAGSKLDVAVWKEFASDRERLASIAYRIRTVVQNQAKVMTQLLLKEDDDEEFSEGALLTCVHKQKERSQLAVRRKKEQVLAKTGRLACEVCGFDFAARFGGLGVGFAECHHTVPLARLNATAATRLADLAIVCSNCHRMLHRGGGGLTLQGLRAMLTKPSRAPENELPIMLFAERPPKQT